MADIDLRVHAKFDGSTWTDISSDVQYEDRVRIRVGAGNQGGRVDPSTCNFRLRNDNGDYTPSNPLGANYPDWNLGTEVRVSVYEGGVGLVMDDAASSYITTPDTAALDITGDLDVRIEFALWNTTHPETAGDFSEMVELIGKQFPSPDKSWLFSLDDGFPRLEWSTDGTNSVEAKSTVLLRQAGSNPVMALRATLDVDNGVGGHRVRFYRADSLDGDWELIDTVDGSGVTSIANTTAPLQIGDASAFLFLPFPQGSFYRAEVRDGINGTVVANPDFTAQAAGTTSFADGAGRTWTVGGRAEITDRKTRFHGEIASLAPGRLRKNFKFVDVQAAGRMRRLQANDEKLKSAVYRDMTKPNRQNIIGYWPMEDGAESTEFSTPIMGAAAATKSPTGIDLADYSLWAASSPIPVFGAGIMRAQIPAYTVTGETAIRFFMAVPDGGLSSTQTYLRLWTNGTAPLWEMNLVSNGNLRLFAYSETGALLLDSGELGFALNGTQKMMLLEFTQDGADIDWTVGGANVSPNSVGEGYGTVNGTLAGRTFGKVGSFQFGTGGDLDGLALGQLSIADDLAAYTNSSESTRNWVTEGATERVARLTTEEDVNMQIAGLSDTGQGGQSESDLLTLLRNVADTEFGILAESRSTLGLLYRSPDSLASQPPVFTIGYGSGPIVEPFEPVYDDDVLVNDFTAERRDGGFARVRQEEGRRSVSDPPTGVGPYEGSGTFNAAYDAQMDEIAGWTVHLGTFDGARFSRLTVRLDKMLPSVDDFCRSYVGDIGLVTGVPLDLAGTSDVKLRIEGYAETIDQKEWTIDYVMSPGEPWDTAFAGHEEVAYQPTDFAWVDTDGSTLAEALSSSETDVDILTGADNKTWTSDPYDSPYDLKTGGEVIRVQGAGAFLNANPFFDVDSTGWEGSSAAIARTTAFVCPHPAAVASLAVTPDGVSATVRARTTLSAVGAVAPGRRYVVSCWVRLTTASSLIRPEVEWLDAAGASLSFSGILQGANAGEWMFLQDTVTAPANASRYRLAVRLDGTPASSDVYYVWAGRMTLVKASAVFDEFGRTSTDTWDTADSGQAWTSTGGAAADYDVLSGYGRHTHPAASVGHHSVTASPAADFDVYCDMTVAATSTGASQFAGVVARYADVDNLYEARLDFTTTGTVNLTIRERVAGVETALDTQTAAVSYTAGTMLRARFQGYGTSLKAKVWTIARGEPVEWGCEVTDSSLTAAGSLGVKSVRNTGNTNASADIRFDNFDLVTPQSFVVERGVNGVTKAQAAGEDVRLANPATVGI